MTHTAAANAHNKPKKRNGSPAHDLIGTGRCLIDWAPETLVASVQRGWERFLSEDQAFKSSWEFCRNPSDPEGPDDGYILRKGGEHDRKEFFHYRPDIYGLFAQRGVAFGRHAAWIDACDDLYTACMHQVVRLSAQIDEALGDTGLSGRVRSVPSGMHVLRFLKYHEKMVPGNQLGKPHVDRNFMTLQVYESHPGLAIKPPRGEWIDYSAEKGKTLAFCGKKAPLDSGNRLHGLPHKIVTPLSAAPSDDKRFSMVFFAHTDTVLVADGAH